jgi:H+/Cl- antiporter ClcA
MEKTLKSLRLIFFGSLAEFVVVAALALVIKLSLKYKDLIQPSSKLTMIAPFLLIVSILVAYFIYDRIAKKSKKLQTDEDFEIKEEQYKLFKNAIMIKIAMFNFVGNIAAIMLFLLYQQTYLYMLGIIVVFYFLAFPTDSKFNRDFIKREEVF